MMDADLHCQSNPEATDADIHQRPQGKKKTMAAGPARLDHSPVTEWSCVT